jgi:oligoribonuclease NrnB/cAMP/cGMP phosphodiesterase (DHH superfamily)
MTGYLTQTLGEWMVKDQNDEKLYPLCEESKKWLLKESTQKFLKEDLEVVFDFVVKGEYCETKEQMIKNYFAKIKLIEHDSL